MRTLLLATALFLALLQPAKAAVMERDFLEPGDGLLTYDNVNKREWLDLPYSYFLGSFEKIQASRKTGEILDKFQFATLSDVEALHESAGPSPYDPSGIDELIELTGFIVRATGGFFGITEFTLGQVANNSDFSAPTFDGTNAILWNLGGTLAPGAVNRLLNDEAIGRQLFAVSSENYVSNAFSPLDSLFEPYLATGDTGPFWLYREVVPEPSTCALIIVASITVATTKLGRRGF